MNVIPLASAFLCCDCDAVGDSSTVCPACAGSHLLALSRVLGRESSRKGSERLYKAVTLLEDVIHYDPR